MKKQASRWMNERAAILHSICLFPCPELPVRCLAGDGVVKSGCSDNRNRHTQREWSLLPTRSLVCLPLLPQAASFSTWPAKWAAPKLIFWGGGEKEESLDAGELSPQHATGPGSRESTEQVAYLCSPLEWNFATSPCLVLPFTLALKSCT